MTMIPMTTADLPGNTLGNPDIDLVGPLEAGEILVLDEPELLELVNTERLSAYRLGGHIRFRASDVMSLSRTGL